MRYSEFKTEKEFKRFLRENKILMQEYFEKYEPKNDLLTGEKIPFESRDTYFDRDFLTKKNMAHWLWAQDDPKPYIEKAVLKRAKKKEWRFMPCQVECRSCREIPALNILDYHSFDFWEETNLIRRFNYGKPEYSHQNLSDLIIGYDTREQMLLSFGDTKMVESKLNFGDYTALNEPFFCNVFFERKSLPDLWGTISSGYSRFQKELDRAQEQNGYIIVVVDSSFLEAENNYIKFSKANPSFIFRRIRELLQNYDNLQFLFSGGRDKSPNVIKEIIKLGENAKKYDLQYLLDMGALNA